MPSNGWMLLCQQLAGAAPQVGTFCASLGVRVAVWLVLLTQASSSTACITYARIGHEVQAYAPGCRMCFDVL
jgi:hypothetical protein